MREDIEIRLLRDALTFSLGEKFAVNENFLTHSLLPKQKSYADLVVWPPLKTRPFVIEYKGSYHKQPISIYSLLQLLKVAETNQDLDPRLILASIAPVGPLTKDEASAQGICVIEASDLSEMAGKISDYIVETLAAEPTASALD